MKSLIVAAVARFMPAQQIKRLADDGIKYDNMKWSPEDTTASITQKASLPHGVRFQGLTAFIFIFGII